MTVVVVTPPAALVSLADAKAQCRVDHSDEDTLIQTYIDAASAHIDGPGRWLGRAVGAQTLELRLDKWCEHIPLRYPPVVSITSVKYVDDDGTEQTVSSGDYYLEGDILSVAYGETWPSLRGDRGGVRIRYSAGYSEIPKDIRAAVLLMVGDLYANRETEREGGSAQIMMSTTVEALLGPFRVW